MQPGNGASFDCCAVVVPWIEPVNLFFLLFCLSDVLLLSAVPPPNSRLSAPRREEPGNSECTEVVVPKIKAISNEELAVRLHACVRWALQ